MSKETDNAFMRAFERAINGGYEPIPKHEVVTVNFQFQNSLASYCSIMVKNAKDKRFGVTVGINDIIFDHAFTEAIWGNDSKKHLKHLALLRSVQGRINYIGSVLPPAQKPQPSVVGKPKV